MNIPIDLSPQAKIYSLGYLLIFSSLLIMMIAKKSYGLFTALYIVINAIVFFLSVYVINCTVVGQCHLYAWIMSYGIIVFSVIACLNAIYIVSK